MRASAVPNLLILALLSQFLSIRFVSAQDRPPHKKVEARQSSVKIYSAFPATKWLDEDVRWIITDEERTDFKALTTDEQREEFIDAFWESRNPNPGSEENTFKEEHYARFVYANERFAGSTPGWKSDRGRIYIVYGRPDKQEQYPGRTDTSPATDTLRGRFSSEVWRYNFIEGLGHDVFFEFLDKCDCGAYLLQHNPFEKSLSSSNPTSASEDTTFLRTWGKWLSEDVCYIITNQEVADFYQLDSDTERDKFVEEFWNRRNPEPGSQENKFKEEHYRRIAYTNLHFAADFPGWKTDRGQIYILYGPPDRIDHHYTDAKPNLLSAGKTMGAVDWEVWHYLSGEKIDFVFADTCLCGRFERQQVFWDVSGTAFPFPRLTYKLGTSP